MFNLFKKNEPEKKDNLSLIAIASLLIHSAKIDENFTEKEKQDKKMDNPFKILSQLNLK